MSRLANSFVRGFGATLGGFAARELVNSASQTSHYEVDNISKKTTKGMWKILGAITILCFIIGELTGPNDHTGLGLFFGSLFWVPIINLFVIRNRKKKAEKIARKNLDIAISGTIEKGKQNGINLIIPDISEMPVDYLTEYSIELLRILNKKIKLKEKYKDHEHLENIMNEIPWIGMRIENLKDIKGNPTSYEVSENTKTKTEILLYGLNKRSGDVFTFKNGILTEFKDR